MVVLAHPGALQVHVRNPPQPEPNQAHRPPQTMKDLLIIAGIVGFWILLQALILPKLGVKT